MRGLRRPRVRPGGAGLPDGAHRRGARARRTERNLRRRRHEHQAQTAGRRSGIDRRCARRRRRARASIPSSTSASEVYKKLVVDAEGKKLLGAVLVGDTSDYSLWHQTVAECHGVAGEPGNHAVSGGRGRRGCTPDQRAGRAAGRPRRSVRATTSPRAASARPSKRAAPRSAHSRPRPRRAPPAAAARRWSRRSSTPSSRSAASASTPRCASTSRTRASSCSTWCASASSRPSTTLLAKHGQRPGLRHLQARGGVHPGVLLERVRAQEAHTRRCRTPTTTSWPTCRRTAPTRWCRACRAARSRPRGSSPSARWRRSTACTPRSPAASASTCSARRCTSCH